MLLTIGGQAHRLALMEMYARRRDLRELVGSPSATKGWAIKEFFLNYKAMTADLTVTLGKHGAVEVLGRHDEADEGHPRRDRRPGADDRVSAVASLRRGRRAVLLPHGDGVSDVDIGATIAFHREHGKRRAKQPRWTTVPPWASWTRHESADKSGDINRTVSSAAKRLAHARS